MTEPVVMTTTLARPGTKRPATTMQGWHYDEAMFPAGQHTAWDEPGQLADVYARHTGNFALDVDAYKDGKAEAWEQSATGRYLAGRRPYMHRGDEGSQRYLIVMTPEQAAEWWPVGSGVAWGDIRSRILGPSPGAKHPSGDTYEADAGPDAVQYPDGTILHTNVVRFDDGLKAALIADGAHGADDRPTTTGDADMPDDDGRCPLVLKWLQDTAKLSDSTTPRGNTANSAVNYLKLMDAEGHHIGGWIGEVIAKLPYTSAAKFEDMWRTAPLPVGTVTMERDCCGSLFGGLSPAIPAASPVSLNEYGDPQGTLYVHNPDGTPTGQIIYPQMNGDASTGSGEVPAGAPEDDTARLAPIAAMYTPVDWHEAWKAQPEGTDWLFEPLLETGTVNALFSRPGTGKSLIAEEIALGLARAGHVVVYVDDENRIADLVERFQAFGATADDLANLRMYSFARLPPLDTPEGGWHLLALAVTNHARLVVLDTTSRMVAGRENDADTFIQLYRCSLVPLKQRGITVLRLDHPGKDESRGQRGSSAKDGDVDTIWRLTEVVSESMFRLEREKSRSGHGAPAVMLQRLKDPLRHSWSSADVSAVTGLAKQIGQLGIPPEAGRPAVRAALVAAGIKASNSQLTQAIRARKQLSGTGADSSDSPVGSGAGGPLSSAPHIGADSGQPPVLDSKSPGPPQRENSHYSIPPPPPMDDKTRALLTKLAGEIPPPPPPPPLDDKTRALFAKLTGEIPAPRPAADDESETS